jgi:hypothetical protein
MVLLNWYVTRVCVMKTHWCRMACQGSLCSCRQIEVRCGFSVLRRCIRDGGCDMTGPLSDAFLCYCAFVSALRYCLLWRVTKVLSNRNNNVFGLWLYLLYVVNPLKPKIVYILFKNPVRTSKRTPHVTITLINWLTLFKFNPLKPKLV